MADVIRAEGLVKTYGDVRALDGLDLAVPEGTVLGLLGPNGAGKTTAVRILTTLLDARRAARAEVAGIDVRSHPAQVRAKIGLSGQYAAVDEYLTGYENLDMIGRLYGLGGRAVARPARASCSSASASTTPATGRSRRTPAACAGASTSPARWSPSRPCCSSTSRRPASTRAAAPRCGRSSSSWSRAARRCC